MNFDFPFVPNGARREHGRHHPDGSVHEGAFAVCSAEALDLQALFSRVVQAYAKEPLEGVRDIIARPLHDRLVGEVADRKRLKHVLSSCLIEFVSAEIIDSEVRLLGGWQDIRFVSRMVVALLGADGVVLAGDPLQARMLSEVWTLQRSIAGVEPRWLVTAMVEDE